MSHPHLTIAYGTSRKDSKIQWFFDSLANQIPEHDPNITVIVVSFHPVDPMPVISRKIGDVIFMPPKPSVFQGPYRLTKEDLGDAAGNRNTSLCMAKGPYLAYVDDLSVLAPTWLSNVLQSLTPDFITLGAYKKLRKMEVTNGVVASFEPYPQGVDSRWNHGSDSGSVKISGEFLYGCSLVGHVENFLKVGGWPEICASLSFEDVIYGLALQNAGVRFLYNRNMLTFESDEAHSQESSFRRLDKGVSPFDKSHSVLNMVRNGCKYFENYYEGGMRRMREEVLSGKPFPIMHNPREDWYDGQPLSDL